MELLQSQLQRQVMKMISSQFYHTGEVSENGMVLTNDIKSCADITDITSDFAHPYYMGYLKYDEMPVNMNFGFYDLQDRYHLVFTKQTERNHAWGFGTAINNGYTPEGGLVYVDPSNHLVYHPSQYYPGGYSTVYRFINQANLAGLCYSNLVNIYGRGIIVPAADLDENDSAYGYTSGNIYSVIGGQISVGVVPGSSSSENIQDWLNGECDITFPSVTISGETVEIKISINDFPTDSAPVVRKPITVAGVDYILFFTIQTYWFPCYAKYNDGNSSYYVAVVPFVEYDDPKGYGEKWYCFGDNTTYTDTLRIVLDYYDGNFIESVSPVGREYYTTGFLGDFFIEGGEIWGSENNIGSECWWWRNGENNHYPGWGRTGIIRGRHIFTSESGNTGAFRIAKMVYPKDIYNHYMLFHKVDTLHNTQQGTVAIQTYTTDYAVALFDELDKPLNERVEENYGAALLTKLRLWQYPNTDVSIDEFTIDDVPPYDPSPQPGDEDSMSGVDWLLNNTLPFGSTAGFVTQYVITGKQLQRFSNVLWATFNDPNFWKSIGTVLSTSLSIDPSDILKFIVSLRMYPCTVPSTSTESSDIYFGRGFVPISVGSSDVNVTDDYTFSLTTGWAKVPVTFKDFRDYEPYTRITVILPFCGAIELTPSQVVDKEIRATYLIDTSNGTCSVALEVRGSKQYVIGTYEGNIAAQVQMSASNLGQILQKGVGAFVGIAQSAGTALVAIAGAQAVAEDSIASATKTSEVNKALTTQQNKLATTTVSSINSIIDNVKGIGDVPYSRFGQSTGFSNYLNTTPMIRIETRYYEIPTNYAHVYGYACNKTVKLDDLSGKGFTVCKNVDLTGVPATQEELSILEKLLQSGVYL